MKIAIVGGGIAGLTSAYFLSQKGHGITVFEKEEKCGGLASGFITENWSWYLERTYHHIFSNDTEILDLSNKTSFSSFLFSSPQTASLYNSRTFPVDTPQDFLKFPLLNLPEKLRAGAVIALLKISPFFSLYEKQSAEEFLRKTMGDRAWIILWEELFRKKFGKYAEKIVASFIWARIKKRTKNLGYPTGGFQNFVDHLVEANRKQGVTVKNRSIVMQILKKTNTFQMVYSEKKETVDKEKFDRVILTLPTPIIIKIGGNLFSKNYMDKLKKIKYLSALNLILETDKPILKKIYWLNVCDVNVPIMCVVQQTNFIDSGCYGNHHLTYVANYIDESDRRNYLSKEELIKDYLPHLQNINPEFVISNTHLFKTPYGQPVYDDAFVLNKPEFCSPVKNLYFANLEMAYPYDRGTNYAVKIGKEVAGMI